MRKRRKRRRVEEQEQPKANRKLFKKALERVEEAGKPKFARAKTVYQRC